jgi:hypothetical protein
MFCAFRRVREFSECIVRFECAIFDEKSVLSGTWPKNNNQSFLVDLVWGGFGPKHKEKRDNFGKKRPLVTTTELTKHAPVQMLIAFADDTNLSAKIRLEKSRYMATASIFAQECLETFQIFECNQSNEDSIYRLRKFGRL